MEAEIGAELFRRSSRNMAITQIGEELLPFAEAILEQEDQMKGLSLIHI